jgi:hypothetical protein
MRKAWILGGIGLSLIAANCGRTPEKGNVVPPPRGHRSGTRDQRLDPDPDPERRRRDARLRTEPLRSLRHG